MKKIVLASDHAGFALKQIVFDYLKNKGYAVLDVGTNSTESCDYPIFAEKACMAVKNGEADAGILVCGTGIGMSLAANKVNGIRAACCSDVFSARYTRLHNDANVLCFGARVVGEGLAIELVDAFIGAEFEGGKHERRVNLLTDIENRQK